MSLPSSSPSAGAAASHHEHTDVAIFWDLENVRIPAWCPTNTAAEGIRNKVAKFGRIVEKRLYYDSRQPTEYAAPRMELDLSGFTLVDCPTRNRKETLDKKLIVDVLCFAWERASRGAKACVVLITSDGDYSYALARLRDIGVFTIVIYRPDIVAKVLIDNANVVMSWEFDVLGGPPQSEEEEAGKHKYKAPERMNEASSKLLKAKLGIMDRTSSSQDKQLHPTEGGNEGKQTNPDEDEDKSGKDQEEKEERADHVVSTTSAGKSDGFERSSVATSGEANQEDSLHAVDSEHRSQKVAVSISGTENLNRDSCGLSLERDEGDSEQSSFEEGKKPNLEVQRKFAIFCSIVKDAQQRNVKEGIAVYSSWAEEALIGSTYYDKIGEKDREGYFRMRALASQKRLIEWGRRSLAAPGKPVVRVKGREDKQGEKDFSPHTYMRLTFYGRAVLEPNLESEQESAWTLVESKPAVAKKPHRVSEESSLASSSAGDKNAQGQENKSNNNKLFVGGLPWQTTEDSLRSYFLKYGPLKQVVVYSGRGFGFVIFRYADAAEAALKAGRRHIIDNASVELKPYSK